MPIFPLPPNHPLPPLLWQGLLPHPTPNDMDDGYWVPFSFNALKYDMATQTFGNYSYLQKEQGSDVYELQPHDSELSSCSRLCAIPFPDCSPFEAEHAQATYFNNNLLAPDYMCTSETRLRTTWLERCIFHNAPAISATCIFAYLCTSETAETPPHKKC